MSSISNRFYVTALEDGTTLHGNLVAVNSLSQAWNGTSAVPDWKTNTDQQPVIYLTLLQGATQVQPDSGYKWYYNDVLITFDSTTHKDTQHGNDPWFEETTYNGNVALKIINNLANSANVDIDTIRLDGTYTMNNSPISFSATIQVRITRITAGSNLGVINFVNGIGDITTKGQVLHLYANLFDSNGGSVDTFKTKWWLNGSVVQDGTAQGASEQSYTDPTSGTVYNHVFNLSESAVVDHATIRCDIYTTVDNTTKLAYSAYAAVDDMQDPEFMYIQYNGANGNAASLRKNENAEFKIWVGTRESADVLGGASTPTYSIVKVQLLDGDGSVIMATGLSTGIPNPDANGWRDLSNTMSGGKATITPHYDTVNGVGKKNLTGIVIAYTA